MKRKVKRRKQSQKARQMLNKAMKAASRKDSQYREEEKLKDAKYHAKKREHKELYDNEKLKIIEYKQKKRQNPEFREAEKVKDAVYHTKKREDKELYNNEMLKNVEYKQKKRQNPEFREAEKVKDAVYHTQKREDKQLYDKEMLNNVEYKQKKRQNPEFREAEKVKDAVYHTKKREDKELYDKEMLNNVEYKQKKRQNPEFREAEKDKDAVYRKQQREDKELYDKEKLKIAEYIQKKRQNPEFREEQKVVDKELHRKKRKCAENQEAERERNRLAMEEKRKDKEAKAKEREADKIRKQEARNNANYAFREIHDAKLNDLKKTDRPRANAQIEFIKEIRSVPSNICYVCSGQFFNRSVVKINLSALQKAYNKNTKINTIDDFNEFCEFFKAYGETDKICHSDNKNIRDGKIPKINPHCGLKFPEVEPQITALSELEERLVSPILVFMQIRDLKPYALNPQLGCKGAVINIPVTVNEMAEVLPRKFSEMSILQLKLKRRLDHKTHYMFETIRPAVVLRAARILFSKPLFKDLGIAFDERAFEQYDPADLTTQVNFIVRKEDEDAIKAAEEEITSSLQEILENMDIDDNKLIAENDCLVANNENDDLFEGMEDLNTQVWDNLERIDEFEHYKQIKPEHDMNCEDVLVRKHLNEQDVLRLMNEIPEEKESSQIINFAPGQKKKPISSKAYEHYDELAFPSIYGGEVLNYDKEIISYTKRVKYEIRHQDRRNCRNKIVLFKAKQKIMKCVESQIHTALRKTIGKMTVGEISKQETVRSLCNSNGAYHFLSSIRTSPDYAEKCGKRALAMVRQLGLPTIFFTITANEFGSPELLCHLKENENRNSKDPAASKAKTSIIEALSMSKDEKTRLVRDDPVSCATFYENRKKAFMKHAKSIYGQFGENCMIDGFARREYQMRGSPHDHGMMWLKDAPLPDLENGSNFQEVADFIDKHISCEYQEHHPNMASHIHVCNQTCYKGKNKSKCRFHFPQLVMDRTRILMAIKKIDRTKEMLQNLTIIRKLMEEYRRSVPFESFTDMLIKLEMTKAQYIEAVRCAIEKPTVFYRRKSNEVAVNTYNRYLLNVWEANHDVQFILEPYAAIKYLFEYCFKSDKGMVKLLQDAAKEAKEGNLELKERLRLTSNAFVNSSLISAQQAADECLGHEMCSFSRAERFINTNLPEKRIVMRKSEKELELLGDDSTDYAKQEFIDQYAKRPPEMDDVCLADFAACYTKKKDDHFEKDSDDEDCDDLYEKNDGEKIPGYQERKLPLIIRYCNFKKEVDRVNHYREQVMLFIPWRNENTELIDVNCEEIYHKNMDVILTVFNKYNELSDEELERLKKEAEEDRKEYELEDIEEYVMNELPDSQKIDVFEQLGIDMKEIKQGLKKKDHFVHFSSPKRVDSVALEQMLQNLNEGQRKICMHVLHSFKIGRTNEKLIILGPAGTGKSFLINTLYQLMTRYCDNIVGTDKGEMKVMLCAPTGCAAFLIGGITCHSAFILPTKTFASRKLKALNADKANEIRAQLRFLKVIIIDEISMVSNTMICQIDKRCRDIFGIDEYFGGRYVIVLGDFLQLPPVKALPVFEPPKDEAAEEYLQHLLWGEFRLFELTEVMRQKNIKFVEALINCGMSIMTEEDVKLIRSREVKEIEAPKAATRLYFANRDVISYNEIAINNRLGNLHICLAVDRIDKKTLSKEKIDEMLERYRLEDIEDTRVPYELKVKVGIKYMILANILHEDGLFNGATGTLEMITFNPKDNKQPLILWLNFNHPAIGIKSRANYSEVMKKFSIPGHLVPILRETTIMTSDSIRQIHEAFRYQFPLRPAEAVTIHKSQGTTLNSVCLDLRNAKNLTASLKYVAMSRCDLDGLSIIGTFNKPPVRKEKNKFIVEIERLRKEAVMQTSFYNIDQKKGKVVVYHNINSYQKHKQDILKDHWYWKADVVVLAESNVNQVDLSEISERYELVFPLPNDNAVKNRSKGLIIFAQKPCEVQDLSLSLIVEGRNETTDKPWHVDLRTFVIGDHYFITGYKSPHVPNDTFEKELQAHIEKAPLGMFITIMGDFNFNVKKPSLLDRLMTNYANQLDICTSTTDANTQIDVIFTNSPNGFGGTRSSYFSDHSALFYQTEKEPEVKLSEKSEVQKVDDKVNIKSEIQSQAQKRKCDKIVSEKEEKFVSKKRKIQNVDLKSNLKPKMLQVNPRDVSMPLNSLRYFDNSATVCMPDDNDDDDMVATFVFNLCPYNAVTHAFITMCHNDDEFRQYVDMDLHVRYFNTFINVLVKKDFGMLGWISSLKSMVANRFRIGPSGYDMEGDVTEVLSDLLNNQYDSILVSKSCSECNSTRTANYDIVCVISQNINELAANIHSSVALNKHCTNCNRIKDIQMKFGNLLFINVVLTNSLTLREIPRDIDLEGNNKFSFKFLIDRSVSGDQGQQLAHFTCYCATEDIDKFIHVDDIPGNNKAKYVSTSKTVNPVLLVYARTR